MLYHLARFYDEWPGEDYDGSSCRGALKALAQARRVPEDLWPYRDAAGHVRFMKPHDAVGRGRAAAAARRLLPRQSRLGRRHAGGDSRDRRDLRLRRRARRLGHRCAQQDDHRACVAAGGRSRCARRTRSAATRSRSSASTASASSSRTPGACAWGNCGFGVLPYEEWVKYGTDAWIAALGVPLGRGQDFAACRSRCREKTVIARAGAITFTSSAADAAAAEGPQGSRARGAPRRRIGTRS